MVPCAVSSLRSRAAAGACRFYPGGSPRVCCRRRPRTTCLSPLPTTRSAGRGPKRRKRRRRKRKSSQTSLARNGAPPQSAQPSCARHDAVFMARSLVVAQPEYASAQGIPKNKTPNELPCTRLDIAGTLLPPHCADCGSRRCRHALSAFAVESEIWQVQLWEKVQEVLRRHRVIRNPDAAIHAYATPRACRPRRLASRPNGSISSLADESREAPVTERPIGCRLSSCQVALS